GEGPSDEFRGSNRRGRERDREEFAIGDRGRSGRGARADRFRRRRGDRNAPGQETDDQERRPARAQAPRQRLADDEPDDRNRECRGGRETEKLTGRPISRAAAVVAQWQGLRIAVVGMAAMGRVPARNLRRSGIDSVQPYSW